MSRLTGKSSDSDIISIDPQDKIEEQTQELLSQSKKTQGEDRKKKDVLDKGARYISDINKISAEDRFTINDVTLAIPPSTIRIDRNNVHYRWHTLRSKHPTKVKSGHGNIQVGLTIYFVGLQAINEGLRRLFVELEHHPFVYIDNTYLKDNLAPDSSNNMAFTVLDFTVRTEPGLVNTLVLDLDMTWFNYKPFAKNYSFRKTWEKRGGVPEWEIVNGKCRKINREQTNSLATKNPNDIVSIDDHQTESGMKTLNDEEYKIVNDILSEADSEIKKRNQLLKRTLPVQQPSESIPYCSYYNTLLDGNKNKQGQEKSGRPTVSDLEQALTFTYYEYKQVNLPPILQFLNQRKLKAGETVIVSDEFIERKGNVRLVMRPNAAQDLENLSYGFYIQFKKRLPITSCFRTFEEQAQLVKDPKTTDLANKAGTSFHEAGLAFDISYRALSAEEYAWLVRNAGGFKKDKNFIGPELPEPKQDLLYGGFKVNHTIKTRNEDELIKIHKKAKADRPIPEMWHFTHQSEPNVREVVNRIYETEETFSSNANRQDAQKKFREWAKDQRKAGWLPVPKFPRVFKRPRSFSLAAANLVPSGSENKIVMISMAMSLNNIVAHLPIISHQYATHQFLGSTDKELYLSLLSHGTIPVKNLQLMNKILEENARAFRKVPESTMITLSNNNLITGLLGLDYVLLESITTETLEGTPDLFAVNVRCTEWSENEERVFTEFVKEDTIRRKIIERLTSRIRKVPVVSKTIDGVIRKITYEKIVTAIGGAEINYRNNAYLFGSDAYREKGGLLGQLIKIIKEVNLQIPDEETRNKYDIPKIKLALLGADKLIEGQLNADLNLEQSKALQASLGTGRGGSVSGLIMRQIIEERKIDADVVDLVQRRAIEGARSKLIDLADEVIKKYIEDDFFCDLYLDTIKGSMQIRGTEGYPDLNLPVHPTTNSNLDTNPDWYFWNAAEEGEEGIIDKVLVQNIKRDFLQPSYGSYNIIDSGKWYNDNYMSPNKKDAINTKTAGEDDISNFDMTPAEGFIGKDCDSKKVIINNRLSISGPGAKRLTKFGELDNRLSKPGEAPTEAKFGPKNPDEESEHDFSSFGINNILDLSIKSFKNDANTLRRAFPTFKIYFIEDENMTGEDDRAIRSVKSFDDFYSYNAIKDIRVVRNRKIPADLAVITMTNVAGLLDNRAFYKGKKTAGIDKKEEEKVGAYDPFAVRPDSVSPWESILLKEGQKIQIRLGYTNDPNKLPIVFNGSIVEVATVDSGDLIQITCQSYAVELVQQVKGYGLNPTNIGEAKNIGSTQKLLSELICEPELVHFGRWEPNAFYNPAEVQISRGSDIFGHEFSAFTFRGLLNRFKQKIVQNWTFLNLPQDDNIYAPAENTYYSFWRKLLDWNQLDYYLIHTTIWDVFQEMELRHPGWIAYPEVFEDRYTMFFGIPSQRYWAFSASTQELKGIDNALRNTKEKEQKILNIPAPTPMNLKFGALPYYTKNINRDKVNQVASLALGLKYNRFVPFRKYHLLSSEHHIISNSIAIDSKDSANTVAIEFRDVALDKIKKLIGSAGKKGQGFTSQLNSRILTVKADDNIDDNKTRIAHESYFNCEGSSMAKRYALGALLRHLKDIYTGEITIIGNPDMKPHDICFVFDSYTDMFGPIGVEQVTHCISLEEGFVTKIVPDLVVTGNEWYSTPLMDAIGQIAAKTFGKTNIANVGDNTIITSSVGTTRAAASLAVHPAFVLGFGIFLLGGYKLLEWSQNRQPVHITPLILHGIPFIAGIDGFSHQNLWSYAKGELRNWLTGREDGDVRDLQNNLAKMFTDFTSNMKHGWGEYISRRIQG